MRNVVQIEASADLLCTRTRAGAIACVELEGSTGLDRRVLASFDGRTGYTDLAVSGRSVCALDAAGVVSCVSGTGTLAGESPGRVHALPHANVRDIAFDEASLCLLDENGVLCDGLGGSIWSDVAVQVLGLPPVRTATLEAIGVYRGCAIDREDGLWCWGERDPARGSEPARAVALFDGVTYTIDVAGTLVAAGRRSAARLTSFWPGVPRDLSLRADTVGEATVVCGAVGEDVRCAQVRMRGSIPEALVSIETTAAHRDLANRRRGAWEIDERGTWRRTGWGAAVQLRDEITWADGVSGTDALMAIDRDGRLWVAAPRLQGIAGATGRRGHWIRLAPTP